MNDYVLSAAIVLNDRFSGKFDKIMNSAKKMNKLDINFKRIENSVGKVGMKLNRMAAIGAKAFAALSVAGAGAGIAGLKVAGDFQALSSQMTTAFRGNKQQAEEYFSWANKFANSTPFSNEQVVDAAVKLKMAGFDPKKVLGDVGDMAAAMSKPLDQAMEAFADASRGEWERFKEFGLNKQMIEEEAKKLGFGELFNKRGQIKNTEQTMNAVVAIMKNRFSGGMKNMQTTLKGQLSTTFGNLKYNIGKMFGMTESGGVRAGSAIDKVTKAFTKLNDFIATKEFEDKLNKWIGVFDKAIEQVQTIAGKFIDYFKKNFPNSIGAIFDKLNDFDATDINSSLDTIIEKFDKIFKSAQRAAGAILGAKLGATFGIKGALIGGGLGLFTPEIMEQVEKMMKDQAIEEETGAARKEKVKKLAEEKSDYDIDFGRGFKGQTQNTGGYGVPQHIQKPVTEKKEIKVSFGDVHINNGMDKDEFFSQLTEVLNYA